MGHLDFEKPIIELEAKIGELDSALEKAGHESDLSNDIKQMQKKLDKLLGQIYSNLTPWDIVQLARHPQRPHTTDYIAALISDFIPLHGDRRYADDEAMIAGVGYFAEYPVAVVGHEKGSDTESRLKHNFGMPRPEGYRKARRIFRMAEKFRLPVLTFIDTPGAYPGVDAEERNQSEAIAGNLKVMAGLGTPVISTVIGEGGSGGALAIGVCDRLIMLQYSIYSVISPEGCASILWKSGDKVEQAAAAMCMTAPRIRELGLVDAVIPEPKGGAHRHFQPVYTELRRQISEQLRDLTGRPENELLNARYEKIVRLSAAR